MIRRIDIVTEIAKDRIVEEMVQKIAHQPLNADLEDLSQMVYLILLEYDEEKLCDLWEHGQIRFFIARIIMNQYRSRNSPFFVTFRKSYDIQVDISGMEISDEERY